MSSKRKKGISTERLLTGGWKKIPQNYHRFCQLESYGGHTVKYEVVLPIPILGRRQLQKESPLFQITRCCEPEVDNQSEHCVFCYQIHSAFRAMNKFTNVCDHDKEADNMS